MSRELRRVPIDFDWPVGERWSGYVMPDELRLPECPDCGGRGDSSRARYLSDLWYGSTPFRPEDNGSTPFTADHPSIRAYAERNVSCAPEFYGTGDAAIVREAKRLAGLHNDAWMHHLNADDIAELIAEDRLWDFTRTLVPGRGWQEIDPPPPNPTPEQVNVWSFMTSGHDAINAHVCITARCEREGISPCCELCGGKGNTATPEQLAAHDAWERTDPPEGDGWQLWESTSEGSPMSPVFATGDDLAEWMSLNPCGFGGSVLTLEVAMRFVHGPGWAPSMADVGGGAVDGITAMLGRREGAQHEH